MILNQLTGLKSKVLSNSSSETPDIARYNTISDYMGQEFDNLKVRWADRVAF